MSNEIRDLTGIYSAEYHAHAGKRGEKQWPAKQDMARQVHEVAQRQQVGPILSVIDVGCGRGWWMEYWAAVHPECVLVGMDGCKDLIVEQQQAAPLAEPFMYSQDLRRADWWHGWRGTDGWDIVMCVEVGEHLDRVDCPGLVHGLVKLTAEYGMIFFSSARPGQKGVHHVTLEPQQWWIDLFTAEGAHLNADLLAQWHEGLQHKDRQYGMNIRRNAMIFTVGD